MVKGRICLERMVSQLSGISETFDVLELYGNGQLENYNKNLHFFLIVASQQIVP